MRCAIAEYDQKLWLKFERYDAEIVDALKRGLPLRRRGWDSERRLWWITPDQVDGLALIFATIGVDLVHVSPAELGIVDAPRVAATLTEAYRALHLMPTAPAELVTAAYRILAKAYHPDRGGDTATMQEINRAYAIVGNNRNISGVKP